MLSNLHFGLEGILPLVLYIGMFVAFLTSVFRKPSVGVYLFVLTLPLQTGRYKLHDFPLGAQLLDILLLGTILGLIVKGQEIIPKTHWKTFFLILATFYYFSLWEGSFFINAPLPIWITDARFSDWKNYVEMFLLALIVPSVIKEKTQVRNLLIMMCLSVLIVNRSYFLLMSQRDLSHFSYDLRDAGPLGYAGVNGLAAFEAMFSSFLLGIYASTKKMRTKIGAGILLATCLYCLLYSFSRGGYVGLLVGMVVVGLLRMRTLLAVAAMMLITWQAVLPESVQERITMTTADAEEGARFDSSAEARLVLWEGAIQLFKRNPVTGSGFDTYEFMGRGPYRDTHNYYVKVLAETGVVGMALFLALLWRLIRSGSALYFGTEDPFWRSLALGYLALVISSFALNFFGDRWTYQQVDGYLWVLLGCVIRGLIAMEDERSTKDLREAVEPPPSGAELVTA